MEVNLSVILGIVFITLKLTGGVTWPWKWVLAPFWVPIVIVIIFWVIFLSGLFTISIFAT